MALKKIGQARLLVVANILVSLLSIGVLKYSLRNAYYEPNREGEFQIDAWSLTFGSVLSLVAAGLSLMVLWSFFRSKFSMVWKEIGVSTVLLIVAVAILASTFVTVWDWFVNEATT